MVNKKNILKQLWADEYVRFVAVFICLYFFLYYFNIGFIGLSTTGGIYIEFLDKNLNYISAWRSFSIDSSVFILKILGYKSYSNESQLVVVGKSGFTLAYDCIGYGIMSVFTAFVIAFPKPIRTKMVFLFCGLLSIQLLNTIRFVLLSIFWNHQKFIFGLDHHDLFNICIYLLLAVICYLYINFTTNNATNSAQKSI